MNSSSATLLICLLFLVGIVQAKNSVTITLVQIGQEAQCTVVYTVSGLGNTMNYHFNIPPPPTPGPISNNGQSYTEQNAQQLQAELKVCTKFSGSGVATCTGDITDSNGNVLATGSKTLDISCGTATGDPKFMGFDGETFHVKGEDAHHYAIISDQHLQLNALFDRHGEFYQHQTFMKQIGLLVGDQFKVTLNVNGTLTLNGIEFTCNNIDMQTDSLRIACQAENERVFKYTVTVADFEFIFSSKLNGIMINLNVAYVPSTLKYYPHGILGQTADRDRIARIGLPGSQQGEGYIEGTYKDYEVNGIFGTDFKFNRFRALNRRI